MFNRSIRRVISGVILLAVFISIQLTSAYAQEVDPKRLEAATELIQTINMDKMMSGILPNMLNVFKAQELRRYPGKQKEIEAIFTVITDIFKNRTNELTMKVAILYAETFTAEELQELDRFYKSDLGQKILGRLPGLMQKSMKMGQEWGTSLAPEIARKLQELKTKRGL